MKQIIRILLLLMISNAHAGFWQDLWLTNDQQAEALMKKGQFDKAQKLFQQSDWQGAAAYRAKDYQQARKNFEGLQSESGYYNLGNALANLEKYEEALKAYDKALAINPDDKDAQFNRKLVESLLKKQQQQKQEDNKQQNSNQNSKNDQQQSNDQQNSGKNQQENQQQQDNKENNAQQSEQDKKQQQEKEQREKEQKEKELADENKEKTKDKTEQARQHEADQQSKDEREKQQAKEQWLRLIPDEPGGLLREKFLRDYIRRQGGWYQ